MQNFKGRFIWWRLIDPRFYLNSLYTCVVVSSFKFDEVWRMTEKESWSLLFIKRHDIGLQTLRTESFYYDEEGNQINYEEYIRNRIKLMIVDTSRVVQRSEAVIYQVIRFSSSTGWRTLVWIFYRDRFWLRKTSTADVSDVVHILGCRTVLVMRCVSCKFYGKI